MSEVVLAGDPLNLKANQRERDKLADGSAPEPAVQESAAQGAAPAPGGAATIVFIKSGPPATPEKKAASMSKLADLLRKRNSEKAAEQEEFAKSWNDK